MASYFFDNLNTNFIARTSKNGLLYHVIALCLASMLGGCGSGGDFHEGNSSVGTSAAATTISSLNADAPNDSTTPKIDAPTDQTLESDVVGNVLSNNSALPPPVIAQVPDLTEKIPDTKQVSNQVIGVTAPAPVREVQSTAPAAGGGDSPAAATKKPQQNETVTQPVPVEVATAGSGTGDTGDTTTQPVIEQPFLDPKVEIPATLIPSPEPIVDTPAEILLSMSGLSSSVSGDNKQFIYAGQDFKITATAQSGADTLTFKTIVGYSEFDNNCFSVADQAVPTCSVVIQIPLSDDYSDSTTVLTTIAADKESTVVTSETSTLLDNVSEKNKAVTYRVIKPSLEVLKQPAKIIQTETMRYDYIDTTISFTIMSGQIPAGTNEINLEVSAPEDEIVKFQLLGSDNPIIPDRIKCIIKYSNGKIFSNSCDAIKVIPSGPDRVLNITATATGFKPAVTHSFKSW